MLPNLAPGCQNRTARSAQWLPRRLHGAAPCWAQVLCALDPLFQNLFPLNSPCPKAFQEFSVGCSLSFVSPSAPDPAQGQARVTSPKHCCVGPQGLCYGKYVGDVCSWSTCTHVHAHMHTDEWTHIHVHTYTSSHTHAHRHANTYLHVTHNVHTCACSHMHTQCIYVDTCTHTCTHMCMLIPVHMYIHSDRPTRTRTDE